MSQCCLAQASTGLFEIPDSISKVRTRSIIGVSFTGTGITLGVLSNEWYGDYQTVPFHFFNDNDEWLQMDKLGHGLASFYGGFYGYNALKWAGVNEKQSIFYGGMYGFTFLLATEIMDGFSPAWGASGTDVLSNGLGTGLFMMQQLYFHKQIVTPKFSYWPTKYASYRPSLLGDSHWNRWLKDYNGQVYWLSFSLSDMNVNPKFFPKWLSLAIGYSGEGMVGGSSNPLINEEGEVLPMFNRERELYFSIDLNFQNIKTKSHFFNAVLKGISFVKFPAPAFRFRKEGVKFLPIQY